MVHVEESVELYSVYSSHINAERSRILQMQTSPDFLQGVIASHCKTSSMK
jgi:hypothetical protein